MKVHCTLACIVVYLVATAPVQTINADEVDDTTQTNVLERFNVGKDADELLLPVSFRGKTYQFLLDTGSDLTVYDSTFREHLGEPIRTMRTKTPNGEIRTELFRSPNAKLGNLDMQTRLPVMCTDLSQLRQVTGFDVYGMIGMDFLWDHVVRIDFDRADVLFLRSSPQDAGRPVRISYRNLHPRVVADVAGIAATFTINTSSSQTGNIDTSLFDQLVERQNINEISSTPFTTLSGTKRWRDGRVDAILLDKFKHKNLVLAEAQGNQLGLKYLSRYVVTFDFPNATMYLKPGKRFDIEDRRDLSGLHILHERGEVLVHSVDEGSPAALAGIRERDVISTVTGRAARQYELLELRRLLRQDGQRIEMTIQREGKSIPTTFQLHEWRKSMEREVSRKADLPSNRK